MLRTRVSLIAATAVTAAAAAAPAPAGAANPYTPAGVCGAGYRVIDSHHVRGPKGGVLGTSYLLWSGAAKKNCSVMIKRRAVGVATWSEASLAKKGGRYMADDGFYEFYAGPLYVRAPGQCVIFGGRMRDARGNGGSWISPWFGHCG